MIFFKTLYTYRLFHKIPIFLTNEQIVYLCNYNTYVVAKYSYSALLRLEDR